MFLFMVALTLRGGREEAPPLGGIKNHEKLRGVGGPRVTDRSFTVLQFFYGQYGDQKWSTQNCFKKIYNNKKSSPVRFVNLNKCHDDHKCTMHSQTTVK